MGAGLAHHPCLPPHDVGVFFINNLPLYSNQNNDLKRVVKVWNVFKFPGVWTVCGHSGAHFMPQFLPAMDSV